VPEWSESETRAGEGSESRFGADPSPGSRFALATLSHEGRGYGVRGGTLGTFMNILSIQSHVAYGHVGNSAAAFALQRLGVEVWPIHTVQLSNHTGYPTAPGRRFDAAHVQELVQGLGERGALENCDGVLSGYIGSAEIGEAILEAVGAVKRANPRALYCCDPVIGDVGRGAFVSPDIAAFIRTRALPAADIVTPNHFELEQLTDCTHRSLDSVVTAIETLRELGPRVVLATSIRADETPADALDVIACDGSGRYRVRTPKLEVAAHGAGDLIAALFLTHYLRSRLVAEALCRAVPSVFGILKRTAGDSKEMALIEAQDELVNPSANFRAEAL
jgi:pyridoxine kinase